MVFLPRVWAVCRSLRSELSDLSCEVSNLCCNIGTPISDEERERAWLVAIESMFGGSSTTPRSGDLTWIGPNRLCA